MASKVLLSKEHLVVAMILAPLQRILVLACLTVHLPLPSDFDNLNPKALMVRVRPREVAIGE